MDEQIHEVYVAQFGAQKIQAVLLQALQRQSIGARNLNSLQLAIT